MTLGDKVKQKAQQYDLPAKAEQLSKTVQEAAMTARHQAGTRAHQNRDKIEGLLDRVVGTINDKTGHKHADKVSKVRGQAAKLVDTVADQRHINPNSATGYPSSAPPAEPGTGYPSTAANVERPNPAGN